MNWFHRNKVALTILVGLALVGLFAIIQSGVAILTIARFAASFHQIAEKNLPALIAASQLSELSQTLVATAPEIALADTHMRRQATVDQVNERATAFARSVADLSRAGADRNLVAEMQRQSEIVIANLKGLDGLVRDRIDANVALDAVMARLPSLAARVRNVADRAIIGEPDDGQPSAAAISATDRARLVEWSAAGLEGVTLMLTAPIADNTSRIERMKSGLSALIEEMEAARAQLPQALQREIGGLHDDIVRFGVGAASLLEARRIQIETDSAIQTALKLIRQTTTAFVASVSALSSATQQDIASRAASVLESVSNAALLNIVTSLLCVGAVTAIFVYVRRAVIRRLKGLQGYMRAQVEGRPAAVSTAGQDEITEMAKATQFFVTRIADREAVLRAVFDNMAGAVVMFDRDLKLAAWNRELTRLLDMPEEFLRTEKHLSDFIRLLCRRGEYGPVDEDERVRRQIEDVGKQYALERTRPNGMVLQIRHSPLPEGGFVSIYMDITDLKKREEVLSAAKEAAEHARDMAEQARAEAATARSDAEHARQVMQIILDNMSDGVTLFDKDLRLQFVNQQLLRSQRFTPEIAHPGVSLYDLLRFQARARRFRPCRGYRVEPFTNGRQ